MLSDDVLTDQPYQQRKKIKPALWLVITGILGFFTPWSWSQTTGITDKSIRLGSLLPLEGDRKSSGLAIKSGIGAALANQSVQGRRIELIAVNDFYSPDKAAEAAKGVVDQGVLLMIGNYGTPTVKATLPLLAEKKIPLLGPYTGAALTGPGDVLNFRASYVREVESVIIVMGNNFHNSFFKKRWLVGI